MPLLQDLELSSGALFGLGNVGLSLEQKSGENIGGEMHSAMSMVNL